MNALVKKTRDLVEESKSRIDFDACLADFGDLKDQVDRDAGMLALQKEQLIRLVSAAESALESRRLSVTNFSEVIVGVFTEQRIVEEYASDLTAWFFYLAYRGNSFDPEVLPFLRILLGKTNGSANRNFGKYGSDLQRYSWLALHGPDPRLSVDNLNGILTTIPLIALPEGAEENFRSQAVALRDSAEQRMALSQTELFVGCFDEYKRILGEASERFEATAEHLDQRTTFGLRVSIGSLREILVEEIFDDDRSSKYEQGIDAFESMLDNVGYRSSSAIYFEKRRTLNRIAFDIESTNQFQRIHGQLRELQEATKDAHRKGIDGVDRLAPFHRNKLMEEISEAFNSLFSAISSEERLRTELDRFSEYIKVRLEQGESLSAASVKRLHRDIGRESNIWYWIGRLRDRDLQNWAKSELAKIRKAANELWQIMLAQEVRRVEEFVDQANELKSDIRESMDMPRSLREILELRRMVDGFSKNERPNLVSEISELFDIFEKKCKEVNFLDDEIGKLHQEIEVLHQRIYSDVDFGDLFRKVNWLERWISLKDFPSEHLDAFRSKVAEVKKAVFRLRGRHRRMIAERETRATELHTQLETDAIAAVDAALREPGLQSSWEALVAIDRGLRSNSRVLSDEQFQSVKEILNGGFEAVRAARTAFAIASEEVFSSFCETLSEIELKLEEDGTRASAFEAIEGLKAIRTTLRGGAGLLRAHYIELRERMDCISQSVDVVFSHTDAQSKKEMAKVLRAVDELSSLVTKANDWESARKLILNHKETSAQVRRAALSTQDRKEVRITMEEIWDEIAERLEKNRRRGVKVESIEETVARLERSGALVFVSSAPRAA